MRLLILFFLSICYFFSACKDNQIEEPILKVESETLLFTQKGVTKEVPVVANQEWEVVVTDDAKSWCTALKANDKLKITVTANQDTETRTTQVMLKNANLSVPVEIKQMGTAPAIELATNRIDLKYNEMVYLLNVVSNIPYTVIMDEKVDWLRLEPKSETRALMEESQCSFVIAKNQETVKRSTEVIFKQNDGEITATLLVSQEIRDTEYEPGSPEGIGDRQLKIVRGEANQWEAGGGAKEGPIENSFDGDMSTIYHSPWYSTKLPVTLTYYLEQPESMDYVVYKPRQGSGNGAWGEVDIEVSKNNGTSFERVKSYDFGQKQIVAQRVDFEATVAGVTAVRFTVKKGYNNLASCAELELYQKNNESLEEISLIFADELCTALKPSVTQEQISAMKNSFLRSIAQSLLDGTYQTEFRVQDYKAYRPTNLLAAELKTSSYQAYENPTGIYLKKGEEVIVFVGDTYNESIDLIIPILGEKHVSTADRHALQPGINKIKIRASGLGYISYFTENYATVQPVKVNVTGGKVNGYFDSSKHKASEWNERLNNTVYDYIDLVGEHIHLTYYVSDLKQYCSDGLELIKLYDEIVMMEFSIMGLLQYNRVPTNRMYISAIPAHAGMFAAGWGVGLQRDIMNRVANPEAARGGSWSIAHELGHVNQLRPNLKWLGTTEVTNNIHSILIRYHYTPNNINLEHENCNDGDDNRVLGGRFNSYLNYGVVKGEPWMYQRGQDKMTGYEQMGGDHFVKLCPIWQLLLYYRIANTPWRHYDWYANISEKERNRNVSSSSNGQLQLNFMQSVCDEVQEDLTDFFERAGMLKPVDREMDDYGKGRMTITEAQCKNLKEYASKYAKPTSPVIYYLTFNSLKSYEKKLSVEGTFDKGVTVGNGYMTVSHSVWKNVTVFETYTGSMLTKVAMVGTNSPDLSTTLVRYPSGSTAIYAVAWDGKRTLVYGTSDSKVIK